MSRLKNIALAGSNGDDGVAAYESLLDLLTLISFILIIASFYYVTAAGQ
jgi:hypothetical protein